MKKVLIFSILLLSIFFFGCKKDTKKDLIKDSQALVKTVYTAATSKKTDIDQRIRKYRLSNNFHYTEFRVYDSFGFYTSLDFEMKPYLENYEIGDDIFVVIALLEFTNSTFEEYTWLQKMIIFEYQDQVFGFMSTSGRMYQKKFGYNFNCGTGLGNKKVNYNFGSYVFLTKNEIASYYDKDEVLYQFNYSEYKDGRVSFVVDVGVQLETHYDLVIKEGSYTKLNKDVVIDLVNSCYIEKIEFSAIITGFDEEDGKIFVESSEYPTLKSVKCRFSIMNSDGFISMQDLKVGDVITIYIYSRYSGYEPVDITVDNIYLK